MLKYVTVIERGESPVVEEQQLSPDGYARGSIVSGNATDARRRLREYRESFGVDLRDEHAEDLDRFCKAGLLELDGDLIRLTARTGALLSNEVFAAFV